MALDIVISVVRKIAEILVDPLWRQFQYLFSYHENIENLKRGIDNLDVTRARVQHAIEEAKRNAETIEDDVVHWLKEVEEFKNVADLVIEDTKNGQMTFLHSRCPNIWFQYSLSCKATRLSSEVPKLIEKGKFDRVGYPERQTVDLLPQDFENFESRVSTVKEVLQALKDSKVSIIGICGTAGVGKTKMANEIAKRVKADKSFDEVAIAVVSQTPNFIQIQGELADQLGLKNLEGDGILRRAERLSQRLGKDDKRILIILDDLWAYLDLASLGIPIKDGQKVLKVLLTSRSRDVCGKMAAQRIIEVNVLNGAEAWVLFKEMSGISYDGDDDMKHTAEEVAKECGGLPLAIVCIGASLKNKKKYAWKDVLRQLRKSSVTTIEGRQNLVTSRIQLSYESLEDKSLVLLCSLFPEDAKIPIEILVRYVKGLQVFKEVEKLNEIRDRVDTIVDHLKARYLLLSSERHRDVKLNDGVRDVCLSIASKGEHVYMSRHAESMEWSQDISSLENFTAISVTCNEMNRLPTGLQLPKLRLLRLDLQHPRLKLRLLRRRQKNLLNIPMEGMMDLRVLQLNGFFVQSPLLLQCLTSLRTLCVECCIFETETSIGCLKQLEVLSFYDSTLICFPKEVSELTNLQLLDLRSKGGHRHSFPSGIFSGLKKLEELYMGLYAPENIEEAKQSWITEVSSLSHLTSLQMCIDGTEILLQILRGLVLKNLKRFYIANSRSWIGWAYELQKNLVLSDTEARALTEDSMSMLLKKTESLYLNRFQGLSNLVPELDKDGLNNLKKLYVGESPDLEYIIDASSMVPKCGLRNLESLHLQSKNLKGLYYGSIQPPWLCNLKRVEVTNCDAMTSFFPQSISKCLVRLQHLEFFNCEKLEEVITMEENTVVEFLNLKTLILRNIPNFKEFCSGNRLPALFSQVSLPALEALAIVDIINCPQQVVGCNMPNGSFHKLQSIRVDICGGVECITKADSVKLLQDLNLLNLSGCEDLQVIFDLEGLKSTEGRLVLLPRLDFLGLRYLPKLASIWRMFPKGIQAFQNLRVLHVYHCYRIKYLLSPPSLAKMLVSLERLTIRGCDSMEEVICGSQVIEEEEVADDDPTSKEFVFPKLQSITFANLEKLKSFGSGGEDHELIFPSLTELRIRKCPQLQKFFNGMLSAPMLQKVWMGQDDIVPVDLKERAIIYK